MKKVFITTLFLIVCGLVCAQSKKKQIESLTFQLDSLQGVIFKERISKDSIYQGLSTELKLKDQEIKSLNTEIDENNKVIALKKSEITLLNNNMRLALDSLDLLKQTLENCNDTLKILRSSGYESYFSTNELQDQSLFSKSYKKVSYYDGTKLLKFQKYPMSDIKVDLIDWLNNFIKTSESRLVYDYESDPIDWKGPSVLVTEMYENGIVVEKLLGYGGQTITMRLPFLSKESAIILFSKLDLSGFQNCWEPDIEFNQGFNGAIVRFSSGC